MSQLDGGRHSVVNDIFNVLLTRLNQNSLGKKFAGNVIFKFYPNTSNFDLYTVNENTLTIDTEEYVPVVETVSEQIAFVDKNKRNDWMKSYLFAVRVDENEHEFDVNNEFYLAMTEVCGDLNGSVILTNGTRYAFKVNMPKPQGRFVHDKSWYVIFEVTINLSGVEQGSFGNDYTVWIAEYVEPDDIYEDDNIVDFTPLVYKMGKALKTVHKKNEADTKGSVSSRTIHIDATLNYRGSDIEELLRSDMLGLESDNQIIYRIRIKEGDLDFHKPFILTAGGLELKNNSLVKLVCKFELADVNAILSEAVADPEPPEPEEED